jgi:hypothetical protein
VFSCEGLVRSCGGWEVVSVITLVVGYQYFFSELVLQTHPVHPSIRAIYFHSERVGLYSAAADRREIVDMTWVLGMARRDCAVLSAGCRSLLYRITPLQGRVTTYSSDL